MLRWQMIVKKHKNGNVRISIHCADEAEQERVYAAATILSEPLGLLIKKAANMIEYVGLSALQEMPIGACDYCNTGNRPGPWHKGDCPLFMETADFSKKTVEPETDL